MPTGSQEGLDINAAVVAQEGLDTLAAQNAATEGQVPTVGSDGKVVFAGGGSGSPAGSDGQIQFNDADAFGASEHFVWDGALDGNGVLRLVTTDNGTAEIKGNGPGVQLQITGADGDDTHVGGEVGISSGNSHGHSGGAITIAAGGDDSAGDGGAIVIASGPSIQNDGGDISIRANPGGPAGNRGGDINVVAGQGAVHGGNVTVQGGGTDGNVQVYSGDGNQGAQVDSTGLTVLDKVGFYGGAPVAKQTGVAVSAAAIHAALVNLGLITA